MDEFHSWSCHNNFLDNFLWMCKVWFDSMWYSFVDVDWGILCFILQYFHIYAFWNILSKERLNGLCNVFWAHNVRIVFVTYFRLDNLRNCSVFWWCKRLWKRISVLHFLHGIHHFQFIVHDRFLHIRIHCTANTLVDRTRRPWSPSEND